MGKKIMILNGSPRANGNTAALIETFTKGAREAGNEVTCFDLQRMNIHPCLGCCKGGRNPDSPCVQKDDMDRIYPAYREADVVVLASPFKAFCYSVSRYGLIPLCSCCRNAFLGGGYGCGIFRSRHLR